ncbi:MAG: DUF2993 domain-containing protein [Oscillatoriophycideae cyanobacterium NC_groundwater_1537_Pr4_S-0.65um_50_18]|nr:DUF2993 domain-containing protein [Oscillatoriophycideae cyanobacterium NC_groundwater_1537_Pr4_S-0.65um_50_18]
MEFLAIFLSSLIGILSPVGLVADRLAEDAIRDQVDSVEHLAVRIDNTPSYRLAQGRADRVRIAAQGIYPIAGVRIAALEIETDPIALNLASLRTETPRLDAPLQAGVKLVLTQEDINQILKSEAIVGQFRDLNLNFLSSSGDRTEKFDLVNPKIEFLPNSRFQLQVTLQGQQTQHRDQITVESGIQILSGQRVQFVDPAVRINEQALPSQVIAFLTGGISQSFDLQRLQASGIAARVLSLKTEENTLTLAAFIQIDPSFSISGIR